MNRIGKGGSKMEVIIYSWVASDGASVHGTATLMYAVHDGKVVKSAGFAEAFAGVSNVAAEMTNILNTMKHLKKQTKVTIVPRLDLVRNVLRGEWKSKAQKHIYAELKPLLEMFSAEVLSWEEAKDRKLPQYDVRQVLKLDAKNQLSIARMLALPNKVLVTIDEIYKRKLYETQHIVNGRNERLVAVLPDGHKYQAWYETGNGAGSLSPDYTLWLIQAPK